MRGAALAFCCGAAVAPSQTLAHKGWAGSGIMVEPWWKSAVFYEVDPLSFEDLDSDRNGNSSGLARRLDYLQGLGADALVLAPLPLRMDAPGKPPVERAYGTAQDFDRLEQEASRRRMRLVVDLPLSAVVSTGQTVALGRFWLARGVGGLRMTISPADAPSAQQIEERTRALRSLCASFSGDRLLIAGSGSTPPASEAFVSTRRHRRAAGAGGATAQIETDRALEQAERWNAATLRAVLAGEQPNSLFASAAADRRASDRFTSGLPGDTALAMEKMVAAAVLTARGLPLIYFGQIYFGQIHFGQEAAMTSGAAPPPMVEGAEPGFSAYKPRVDPGPNTESADARDEDRDPQSLLNWYRRLGGLRHTERALDGGTLTVLATGYDDVVAWVRRSGAAPPVVVVCNLSAQPVSITLSAALHQAGLASSSGLAPLALSFAGSETGFTASGIALPGFGTYVGEVHQPGLEDAAPLPRRRRR